MVYSEAFDSEHVLEREPAPRSGDDGVAVLGDEGPSRRSLSGIRQDQEPFRPRPVPETAVELFFKELKQTCELHDFVWYNENAVKWQIWGPDGSDLIATANYHSRHLIS